MREIQYILIDTGSESNRINMGDVGKVDNGIQISDTHNHVNKIVDFLIHAHFSYSLTRKMEVPGKAIWSKYCVLSELTTDDSKEYYIVVVNNAIHRLSVRYLNKLCQKENVHLYSLLLDSFKKLPKPLQKMIRDTNFERVYSFQKSDCEKYGFSFTNQIYSKVDLKSLKSTETKSDVYFIGAEKGRINEIYSVYQYLTQNGLNCDFTVVVKKYNEKKFRKKYPGMAFTTSRIVYTEILKKIDKTKCIFELCQAGQDGLTMRFYEALFYNKKLITSNVTAKTQPFFNQKYMQVIQTADDIDSESIRENSEIDYNYGNEFSPVLFIESLPKQHNGLEEHI